MQFWLWSYNIKSNPLMGPRRVRDCNALILDNTGSYSIGGKQEHLGLASKAPWYFTISRKMLDSVRHAVNTSSEIPMYAGKSWSVLDSRLIKAHSGVHNMTPTRYISSIEVRRGRIHLGVVNLHFINYGAHKPIAVRDPAKRAVLWQMNWDKAAEEILRLSAKGIPVIVFGDFNHKHVNPFMSRFEWIKDDGIDKIGYAPAKGYRVRCLATKNIPVGKGLNESDHPFKAIKLSVTRV